MSVLKTSAPMNSTNHLKFGKLVCWILFVLWSLGLSSAVIEGATLLSLPAPGSATSAETEADALATGKVFPSPITTIFAPPYFDDNDNAQVILQGYFDSSCAKPLITDYRLNKEENRIDVWAQSELTQGKNCKEGRFAFLQVVNLGHLVAGDYEVNYSHTSPNQATLTIEISADDADNEEIFAPVSDMDIDNGPIRKFDDSKGFIPDEDEADLSGKRMLTLSGSFPFLYSGCMRLKEIRVDQENNGDIIVVRPLAVIEEEGSGLCQHSEDHDLYDYKAHALLPELKQSVVLVHLRLDNGTSMNRLIEVE